MLLDITTFLPILIFTGFVALLAGMVLLKRRKQAIRSAEMEQMAPSMGLTYSAKDYHGFGTRLQGFDLFKRESRSWGRGGKVTNVLSGQIGDAQVYLFDYSYLVSTGKSVREIKQTVFFVNDSQASLPNFTLKPENWWRKVMLKIGMDKDINFPENPDFSDRFWLKGEIESLIRKQFSPELQQFLTERPPATIEGNNYYFIAYKPGKILSGEQLRIFFEHGCQLTALLQQKEGKDFLDLAQIKAPVAVEKRAE